MASNYGDRWPFKCQRVNAQYKSLGKKSTLAPDVVRQCDYKLLRGKQFIILLHDNKDLLKVS